MKTKSRPQTPSKPSWKNAIQLTIAASALCASPGSRGDANCNDLATTHWINPGTGDWFDPLNWVLDVNGNHAVPSSISPTSIKNGGTASVSTTNQTAYACSLVLGELSGQNGNLSVNGGTLNTSSPLTVGSEGSGKLTITNGGVVTTNFGGFIGASVGSNGAVTVDGTNSTWTINGDSVGAGMYVGGTNQSSGGTGLLTVTSGGTVSAAVVYLYKSGTLTGNGTVKGTNGTTIEGTLGPSGTLTITGNLSFGQFANMRCNVSSTSVDNAQVSGIATLNGKLSVTVNVSGDFTLLHADGGLNFTEFSSYSFTYTGCLSPSIVYHNNSDGSGDVILHVPSTCE